MKRFALLLGALALSIQLAGCGGDGSGGTPGKPVSRAEDTNLPKEVREYEAKHEKQLEETKAKALAKAAKSKSR